MELFRIVNIMFFFSVIALLLFDAPALAETLTDSTYVTLSGDILETPCSIAPGNRDQTIDFGATPVALIAREGMGPAVPFVIRLTDCSFQRHDVHMPNGQRFIITFDGVPDGHYFATKGEWRGIALKITDIRGYSARPGIALPSGELNSGGNELHYTLRLISSHNALHEENYSSVINFRLNYF